MVLIRSEHGALSLPYVCLSKNCQLYLKHDERVSFKKKIRILFVPSCVCDFSGIFCFYHLSQRLSNAYTFLEEEEEEEYEEEEEEEEEEHLLAVEVVGSKWAEGALLGT
jgi:hypothetical protein